MEKLLKYLERKKISQRRFSRTVGTSVATFNRAMRGLQLFPLDVAVNIERETAGKIRCKDLVPKELIQ